MGVTRTAEIRTEASNGVMFDRRTEDGIMVAKYTGTAARVWDATLGALTTHQVNLTLVDRGAGRAGDTVMVLMRRWNGQPLSVYLACGSTMTGPRADQERVNAVLLAQLTRLKEDTIAVAIHFSGVSKPVASGASGTPAPCTSSSRIERDLFNDIARRLADSSAP